MNTHAHKTYLTNVCLWRFMNTWPYSPHVLGIIN